MKKKRIIKFFFMVVLFVITIELLSFFILKNFNIGGKFQRNNDTLFKIREILDDDEKLNQYLRYVPQHSLAYTHNPHFINNKVKINNSFGFRGDEFQKDKSDGVIRVICMGGSTTYGFLIDELNETYPYLLEKELKSKFPNKKIEVINAGVEAASSIEELMLFQFKIKYLNPDIIIIRTGGNDASNISEISSRYSPDMNFLYQEIISIPTMNRKLKWLLKSHFFSLAYIWISYVNVYNEGELKHGVPSKNVGIYRVNWFNESIEDVLSVGDKSKYNFLQNFDLLTDLFVKDSIEFYSMPFLLNPFINHDSLYLELNNLNNEIMKEITINKGGTWIYMAEEIFPYESWIGDDCHFNFQGNKILSTIIADSIKLSGY